jgi:type IV secretion system protein TrbL
VSGCEGWNTVNPLCRAGQVVGGATKAVGNDIFESIAKHFAGVANAAVSWLWQQLNTATTVDLTSKGIKTDLIATGGIAALITLALFLIQVIASALRQDPGGLGRAVRGMGVAFIGAAFAIAATQILLVAVDELANGVVSFALGTNIDGLGSKLIAANTLGSISNPAGLLLMSLVLIAAVVVIWVALMIRKMLIIVSAVFAPIAFSGSASDISRSWVRRWIEFTVALVFSKLILVIIFMIGLTVLNGSGQTTGSGAPGGSPGGSHPTQAMTSLVVGALILLLAGFAPWIAIKMVHFAGESFHAVHAQAGTAAAGAQTVIAAPQKVAATTRTAGMTSSLAQSAPGAGPSPSGQQKTGGWPSGGPRPGGGGSGGPEPSGGAETVAAPVAAARATANGASNRVVSDVQRVSPPDTSTSS